MTDATFTGFGRDNLPIPAGDRVLPLFSLKGRTAIVTGAGANLGLAITEALAEAGANVALWYNGNDGAVKEAERIAQTFGVKAKAYKVQVTDREAVEKVTNQVVADLDGRLDVFVANAGIPWFDGPLLDGPADKAAQILDVNVNGTTWCAIAAGKVWRRQKKEGTTADGRKLENFSTGSFVATSSYTGTIAGGIPVEKAPYNASKAAILQLCKSLAVEFAEFARVNTISPGYTKIPGFDYAPPEMRKAWIDSIPAGREGEPKEVKGPYLFLASDASSYITGTNIFVDGGRHNV